MINGPGIYNPAVIPKGFWTDGLVIRQDGENRNPITPEDHALRAMPIKLNYKERWQISYAPYFREVLRDEAKKYWKPCKNLMVSNYNIYEDGLKIYTTINPVIQTMQKML